MSVTAKALDKSARVIDANGWMNVEGNPITKAGVFDYYGRDIPGAPDPDRIYQVYRPAEELNKPETLESFKLMPFINDHTWLGVEGVDPDDVGIAGVVGEKIYFDPPYVRANLRVYSSELKQALESGKVELSPAYKYDVDPTPGVFQGRAYQFVQRNIRCGNHLALVDEGRTGPDVAVMDQAANHNSDGEKTMSLEEILAAIANLTDEDKAKLATAVKLAPAVTEPEPLATDGNQPADINANSEKPAEGADNAPQDNPDKPAQAADEDPQADAKAQDAKIQALTQQVESLTKQVKAQDSAALLKELGKRNELAQRLTPFVGAFACDSMDTVAVAKYGLEKLGIKNVEKGHEISALNAALSVKAAQPQSLVAFGLDAAPGKANAVSTAIDDL